MGSNGDGHGLVIRQSYLFLSFRCWNPFKMHYNRLRYMAKRRNAQYHRGNTRLLRAMSRAARIFNHAQGKERLEALRRYVAALNDFSDSVLRELPQGQHGMIAAPRRGPGPSRPTPCRQSARVGAGVLKLRMANELIPYVGAAGARQILKSVSVGEKSVRPAVESVLGVFLGKAAASQLVDRMIDRMEAKRTGPADDRPQISSMRQDL